MCLARSKLIWQIKKAPKHKKNTKILSLTQSKLFSAGTGTVNMVASVSVNAYSLGVDGMAFLNPIVHAILNEKSSSS